MQDLERFGAAIKRFQEAIDLALEYAEAYFNLGAVNFRIMRFEAAVNTYKVASSLDPTNPQIDNNLGLALYN